MISYAYYAQSSKQGSNNARKNTGKRQYLLHCNAQLIDTLVCKRSRNPSIRFLFASILTLAILTRYRMYSGETTSSSVCPRGTSMRIEHLIATIARLCKLVIPKNGINQIVKNIIVSDILQKHNLSK